MPRLTLLNLLRRRRTTLARYVRESGVQTYSALVTQCERLGVLPPSVKEFEDAFPQAVTCPTDGVVVVEPMPVVDDLTGNLIDPDAPVHAPGVEATFSIQDVEEGSGRHRSARSTKRTKAS